MTSLVEVVFEVLIVEHRFRFLDATVLVFENLGQVPFLACVQAWVPDQAPPTISSVTLPLLAASSPQSRLPTPAFLLLGQQRALHRLPTRPCRSPGIFGNIAACSGTCRCNPFPWAPPSRR